MGVKAKEITGWVEQLAPLFLAEQWDNSGWQVGDPTKDVERVMVTLDVDEDVINEAVQKESQLIISHHPLLMKGLKNLRLDDVPGRLLAKLIKNDLGSYAAHTNLDTARGGVNDVLAQKLGLRDVQVLYTTQREKYFKLVVFVPESHLETVMEALRREEAGWIGNYSDCTFQVKGTGTFRPGEGTNPYIGSRGTLECVEEVRLETILPVSIKDNVVKAMLQAHPYEEVAYDLYSLALDGPAKGLGRVGNLDSAVPWEDFVETVKGALGVTGVRYGYNGRETAVQRVAVCGGSGADLWPAARAAGAQVLVTGDIKYHTAKDMLAGGISFIDAGHYGTEKIVVNFLADYLRRCSREMGQTVEVLESVKGCDPFQNA